MSRRPPSFTLTSPSFPYQPLFRSLLAIALGGLTIDSIVNDVMQLFRGYKTLRPAGLTALVNRDNALVGDLRPMADFEKGHIPGSKNVQISQFDPENKQLASAKSLPVVLVCKTGQTAGTAAKRLKKDRKSTRLNSSH